MYNKLLNISVPIKFGPDKSQIVRAFAIFFMICLHNHCGGLFKICVPIFTFLVGYGYAFAKQQDVKHALKRSWHLLSHFWLILLGIFFPIGVIAGGYEPTVRNLLYEMFGLTSYLNWYSWYIYFYLLAMFIMIPVAWIVKRLGLWGLIISIAVSFVLTASIHIISGWSDNVFFQALFDTFLCSPVMFVGFYLADKNIVSKISLPHKWYMGVLMIFIMVGLFFFRTLPHAGIFDMVTVPAFVIALVALFNIIQSSFIINNLICIGKESMNMWFIHALFASTYTAAIFSPLVSWLPFKLLIVLVMTLFSYYAGKFITHSYNVLSSNIAALPPTV